ncbi:hypothetical protein [Streptomyces tailanensis]|uniref:hypothetical protein n=1 Tax=Streptomyces tailanensis TaxID=2569858 RepID=UPI00122E545A|nr:hypothetical protein [Streptomyces tailanensis]
MKLGRSAAWVGVTAAALAATTACGAESVKQAAEAVDKSDAIMAALARATDRTQDLGSAQVKATTVLNEGAPVVMEGTYSWGDGLAYDVVMDTEAAQMQELTDDPSMRALFVDGAYYYDIDPQPSGPLQGKEWMRIDASAMFGDKGASALDSGQGGDPTASMRTLKYANDVDDLGTETVSGREVTHYRGVVRKEDFGRFKDTYAPEDETLANQLTGGVQKTTIDIWVGDDDLPVRIRQELGAMTVTMDFGKFSATKKIQAPPASQTGDLTDEVKEAAEQG